MAQRNYQHHGRTIVSKQRHPPRQRTAKTDCVSRRADHVRSVTGTILEPGREAVKHNPFWLSFDVEDAFASIQSFAHGADNFAEPCLYFLEIERAVIAQVEGTDFVIMVVVIIFLMIVIVVRSEERRV